MAYESRGPSCPEFLLHGRRGELSISCFENAEIISKQGWAYSSVGRALAHNTKAPSLTPSSAEVELGGTHL